jgi:hypothetical protein
MLVGSPDLGPRASEPQVVEGLTDAAMRQFLAVLDWLIAEVKAALGPARSHHTHSSSAIRARWSDGSSTDGSLVVSRAAVDRLAALVGPPSGRGNRSGWPCRWRSMLDLWSMVVGKPETSQPHGPDDGIVCATVEVTADQPTAAPRREPAACYSATTGCGRPLGWDCRRSCWLRAAVGSTEVRQLKCATCSGPTHRSKLGRSGQTHPRMAAGGQKRPVRSRDHF